MRDDARPLRVAEARRDPRLHSKYTMISFYLPKIATISQAKVENKKVFATDELSEALEVITAIRNDDSSMKRFGLSKYPYIADFLNKEEIYLIGGNIGKWNK